MLKRTKAGGLQLEKLNIIENMADDGSGKPSTTQGVKDGAFIMVQPLIKVLVNLDSLFACVFREFKKVVELLS